ncbi:MAG: cysteine desulfurase [Acidimicrobiales bacterium]|nr:cysteine desulfurase [Acidimicrobiales bacterium]|tara:strand:+ start:137 stop:1273 length:1137 start_codon:yes stop_codon:yes gene_type:complete
METYLDHAASTPVRQEVIQAMLPWLSDHPGNPSGSHRLAREARRAIDDARDHVASLVGAEPGNVIFTSGGTESDNLAIDGVLGAKGGQALCSATEHPAVLEPVRESGGIVAPTDDTGRVDLESLANILDSFNDISLVSIMTANNETGVINNIDRIADLVLEKTPETMIHTDAVQATSWLDITGFSKKVHLVSLTGHKFGGPKGAGALILKDGVNLSPVIRGGGQERERRSGTQNVPAIVGLGEAARLIQVERLDINEKVTKLRDKLENGLIEKISGTSRTLSQKTPRTPGIAHLCFKNIENEALLFLLENEGVYASAASSCASGAQEASHVLQAMGVDLKTAGGSIRFSLGQTTTEEEIEYALTVVPNSVEQLREFEK